MPPLTLGYVFLTGLQRSAKAESRAETEDEAKFSLCRHRRSQDKSYQDSIKDNILYKYSNILF